jgi:hypothetical protein
MEQSIDTSNHQHEQVSTSICPLMTEPEVDLRVRHCPHGDHGRERLVQLIRQSFNAAYEADIQDYCDELIGLDANRQLLGVAGLRAGNRTGALFSEQYLDVPADQLIRRYTGEDADRRRIVEIGNLAVSGPGNTRWLFAVLNTFLQAAGFQWVVCTAISPLISMFRRIGLDPVVLCDADPSRLSSDSSSWGRYYDLKPKVCFGSIESGHRKVRAAITSRQPRLQKLYAEAHAAGAEYAASRKHLLPAVNQ